MALSPISGVAFRESFLAGVCEYVTIMIDQDVTSGHSCYRLNGLNRK